MEINLFQLMGDAARIGGSTLRARSRREKADVAAAVAAHVLPLLADGRVRVPVCDTFPLSEAEAAYDRFAQGAKLGKVVLVDADDRGRPLRRGPDAVGLRARHARRAGRRPRPSCRRRGPGPLRRALRWQDLQDDRAAVGVELQGSSTTWTGLRVLGFARTLAAPACRGGR